jgi:hypothetical protein
VPPPQQQQQGLQQGHQCGQQGAKQEPQQGDQQGQQQGARELRRVPSFNLRSAHGRAAEVAAAVASGCWADTVGEACIRAADLRVPGDLLACRLASHQQQCACAALLAPCPR